MLNSSTVLTLGLDEALSQPNATGLMPFKYDTKRYVSLKLFNFYAYELPNRITAKMDRDYFETFQMKIL